MSMTRTHSRGGVFGRGRVPLRLFWMVATLIPLTRGQSSLLDSRDFAWPPVIYRINCGGLDIVDRAGRLWARDSMFDEPSSVATADRGTVNVSTDYGDIYLTQRQATRIERSLAYTLPLRRRGAYLLRLHFVEFMSRAAGPGERVISIEIQGEVRDTLDVGAEAGLGQPIVRTYAVDIETDREALQLELLGVVRNPCLGAMELMGPASTMPEFQFNGEVLTRRSRGAAENARRRPPAFPIVTKPEISGAGSLFNLAHDSTGRRGRGDLQFGAASMASEYIFRFEAESSETGEGGIAELEGQCAQRCGSNEDCLGFFIRSLPATIYCAGLRSIGHPVATRTVTRCWARVVSASRVANMESAPLLFQPPSMRATLLEASGRSDSTGTANFELAFEGRTAENPGGPWLTFSTTNSREFYVFGPQRLTPRACSDRCEYLTPCIGVVITLDPDSMSSTLCVGLRHLGFKRGIETPLTSISLFRQSLDSFTSTTTQAIVRDDSSNTAGSEFEPFLTATDDDFELDDEIWTAKSEGHTSSGPKKSQILSAGALVGVVIAILTLLCVVIVVGLRHRNRTKTTHIQTHPTGNSLVSKNNHGKLRHRLSSRPSRGESGVVTPPIAFATLPKSNNYVTVPKFSTLDWDGDFMSLANTPVYSSTESVSTKNLLPVDARVRLRTASPNISKLRASALTLRKSSRGRERHVSPFHGTTEV